MVLEEYRSLELSRKLASRICDVSRNLDDVLVMHVCGSHEWTITHYGIRSLLPDNVEVRSGPGCPVCVTPAGDIDTAVNLASSGVTILTYGDMSRARGSKFCLTDAKARGGDVRVVYSVQDAISAARREPSKEFVFFAVGFETTVPPTAYEILKGPPPNMSFLASYRYVPPAVGAVAMSRDLPVDGFINAGHASTVSGMRAYLPYFEASRKPMIFCGFEPVDVLISLLMLLEQLSLGEAKMENEYSRSVTWEGNLKAQRIMAEAFDLKDGYWRGMAIIPRSGFELKDKFAAWDARKKHELGAALPKDEFVEGAQCGEVVRGAIDPPECSLYMRACTPQSPKGPTMVSAEGTCKIWADHRIVSDMKCRT